MCPGTCGASGEGVFVIDNQLNAMEARFEELNVAAAQPDVIADVERYRAVIREISELEGIVTAWRQARKTSDEILQAREMLRDPDMADMAAEELAELEALRDRQTRELKMMLLPRDPNDDRNVIVEIRPAAGGDEAALFAGLLLRMYQRYAERHRMKYEVIDITETELKGIKEAVVMLSGGSAWSRLKYESGVHRVQRVPVTEAGGRIHTSTATVAVLPEAEEVEVEIRNEDLRIDTYRASGHGGQYINRTDSAVRITHLPSGLVVTCQDEKSQLKNKDKAMKVLRSRLVDLYQGQKNSEYAQNRREQVGSGERNERIRTYNFPQGRVTDHRCNLTLYKIDEVLDGDLDEIIDALALREQEEKMKALEAGM